MQASKINDIISVMLTFNSIDEKVDKLKEWKLLSPKAKELKDIYYKNKNASYECEVIGYLTKETKPNCINRVYETAVIKVNENIIRIAPMHLLEMQKKNFSIYSGSLEQSEE